MPYIDPYARAKFRLHADHSAEGIKLVADTAGELQYCIAKLVMAFLRRKPAYRYQDLNDVVGALEGAKLEFYRRILAPYEDGKIQENGDVE